jgi:hypothetical protein
MNDIIQVTIDITAGAVQLIGGSVPRAAVDEYKRTGNMMSLVTAVLTAEDSWESEWEHDDLQPFAVTIKEEKK